MKQHHRRIKNLERAIEQTIRVIVMRDEGPDQVLVMRKNEPPHQKYFRDQGESATDFLRRAGCSST
jgi:hypothetical protein